MAGRGALAEWWWGEAKPLAARPFACAPGARASNRSTGANCPGDGAHPGSSPRKTRWGGWGGFVGVVRDMAIRRSPTPSSLPGLSRHSAALPAVREGLGERGRLEEVAGAAGYWIPDQVRDDMVGVAGRGRSRHGDGVRPSPWPRGPLLTLRAFAPQIAPQERFAQGTALTPGSSPRTMRWGG